MKHIDKIYSILILVLIYLYTEVSAVLSQEQAGGQNVCGASEGQAVCPGHMLCSVDTLGNPVCHENGVDLPESHCRTAGRLLELKHLLHLSPEEECDVFSDSCPADKVCCITRKGHHCFSRHDADQLRDDFFKK